MMKNENKSHTVHAKGGIAVREKYGKKKNSEGKSQYFSDMKKRYWTDLKKKLAKVDK